MADVFDDYTMSLIQFGYVALFSAAFPLAPLLAMINNLVQTRVDAHKICKTRWVPSLRFKKMCNIHIYIYTYIARRAVSELIYTKTQCVHLYMPNSQAQSKRKPSVGTSFPPSATRVCKGEP